MKLLRVGPSGAERPAALDAAGQLVELTAVVDDITGAVLSGAELDRIRAAREAERHLTIEGMYRAR